MPLRRLAAASALVCLAPLLAACREEEGPVALGDQVQAREDDQFESGQRARVTTPMGVLRIRVEDPVDEVAREDTRDLEALSAPEGATFVPISWEYDASDFKRIQPYLTTSSAPKIDLVTGGESYRLLTPDSSEAESFYVLVDGDAEELTMDVTFDSVTQTIDLAKGKTIRRRAAPLYQLDLAEIPHQECDTTGWFEDGTGDYSCDVTGPLFLPYAGKAWAEPGREWLVLTLGTEFRRYGVTDGEGGGALYAALDTALRTRLDGEQPVEAIEGDNDCPSVRTGHCIWETHLVFDVPDDFKAADLEIEQEYPVRLGSSWGGIDTDQRMRVTAEGEVRIKR